MSTATEHLLAEVRALDSQLAAFLLTYLAAHHPATAIAGLDAAREMREGLSRHAAGLPETPDLQLVDPVPDELARRRLWSDTGSGPGR